MGSFIDHIKNNNDITKDDILKYAECYQEILNLQEKYQNTIIGRKKIAKEIREKLVPLDTFLYFLTNYNRKLDTEFQYAQYYVSDYQMALRILLKLANQNQENFSFKKFHATDLATFETNYNKEDKKVSGNIWVIGEKKILDNIDEKKNYVGSSFGEIANNILRQKHSLIILTDHYYDKNVKPWEYDTEEIQEINISINGMYRDISCYLYEDNLKKAVNQFLTFIDKNGADIKGMNEEKLLAEIKKIGSPTLEKCLKKEKR